MGSVGSPNSWAPYYGVRDCSLGICSLYCPRWCYIIYPPPPPFAADDNSGTSFSPLIIAVISILASAFLLITYYLIISKYCRRRGDQNLFPELQANRNQMNQDQWQLASTGLDEELIKSIAVCKYKKGDGLVEGTDCAVCLSEFQEDERLRLLPECSHAFHLPCIDTWLKSHSNCPLCRANIVSSNPLPPPPQSIESYSNLNMSALQIHHRNDLVLVVDDPERAHSEEVVASDVSPKNMAEFGQEQFRRSISLDSFSCQGHILVADILHMKEEDDDEDIEMEIHQLPTGNGSSRVIRGENSIANDGNGFCDLVRSRAAMKRSISTGRFMFTRHNKGKSSIIPS